MYNRKRQVRESTNQLFVYEPTRRILQYIPPKGITPQERKDHTAAVFRKYLYPIRCIAPRCTVCLAEWLRRGT